MLSRVVLDHYSYGLWDNMILWVMINVILCSAGRVMIFMLCQHHRPDKPRVTASRRARPDHSVAHRFCANELG
jgi:hypothetical protein